jgi:hypothetical protein
VTEPTETSCSDAIDNDCDGFVDLDDPNCGVQADPENCSDGVDNDNDGLLDCADNDCALDLACTCVSIGPEPNESGFTAFDLGVLQDTNADIATVTGNLGPGGDVDWYQFTAVDVFEETSESFSVDIRLTANPNSQFRIAVSQLQPSNIVCNSMGASAGSCNGGLPDNYVETGSVGLDNSAVYYVAIERVEGNPESCDSYTLEVSNGLRQSALFIQTAELIFPLSASGPAGGSFGQVFGRVFAGEHTASSPCGADPRLVAEVGVGPGPAPLDMTWYPAECTVRANEFDHEYVSTPLAPLVPGMYSYVYRFSGDGGATWTYATPVGQLQAN